MVRLVGDRVLLLVGKGLVLGALSLSFLLGGVFALKRSLGAQRIGGEDGFL